MSTLEIQNLADDILENGLKENILLTHDGTTLVDGRNRIRACGVAGVDPRYSYLPKNITEAEITRIIASANVKTRNLTPGQLAMIGHDYTGMIEQFPSADLKNYPPLRPYDHDVPRSYAAVVLGISSKTIWQAKTIVDFQSSLAEEVRQGQLRLNTAYERTMAARGLRPEPGVRPANLPKDLPSRPPNGRDASRRGVEARLGWLRYLAGLKLSSAEISKRLDISDGHVRRLARRYNIALPGDAWSYKRRKPNLDVNRVAQVVADDLMAMRESIPQILGNLDQIDEDKTEEWAKIYWTAARQLDRLARSLNYGTPKKRINGDNDSTT